MWVAGTNTETDWADLKRRLQSTPPRAVWDEAFQQFHMTRIRTRYLEPMKAIRRIQKDIGEGFAITALFCSLCEFLESTERGHHYRYRGRHEPKVSRFEYNDAGRYFKEFLKTRQPFSGEFPARPKRLADSFYRDVRCGLLHEARTKGSWFISAEKSSALFSRDTDGITLFRNRLEPMLRQYLAGYRRRLLSNAATQRAFIRKWDHICQP
jgi:hypothetical protein